MRFNFRLKRYLRPLDWVITPTVIIGKTRCGEFKFLRLQIFWLRRGLEFSIGTGPFSIIVAEWKNAQPMLKENDD